MPKPLVLLLLRWYKTQHLCIRWMGKSSDYFQVSSGVHQGGDLSPILFTIHVDMFLSHFVHAEGDVINGRIISLVHSLF